ncbi:MAG: J domain-containing protein [Phormidesmis sp.]
MVKFLISPGIEKRIQQLSQARGIDVQLLEEFALFVLKDGGEKVKPLSMNQLKTAVLKHFSAKDTAALRKSGSFKMATDGMDKLNLRLKSSWETLYREFVGVLPGEDAEIGNDCINGIDIFKYFRPWKVFGLEPQAASDKDIKLAYRQLSKQYHPDNPETGNARIFDRINTMYQSISAGA